MKNKTYYDVGETVWGLDKEKNIFHHCFGKVEEVHKKLDGTPFYKVKFQDVGTFLCNHYQLTQSLEDLDK